MIHIRRSNRTVSVPPPAEGGTPQGGKELFIRAGDVKHRKIHDFLYHNFVYFLLRSVLM